MLIRPLARIPPPRSGISHAILPVCTSSCAEKFSADVRRRTAGAAAVERLALHPPLGALRVDRARFLGHQVEQARRRAECRRRPVRRAGDRWTGSRALGGGLVSRQQNRPAVLSDPARPGQLLDEGFGQQELARQPVEDIEEAVAIAVEQELARPAAKLDVDEHRRLGRVPVVQVVRRELEMPLQFARVRVEREDGIRVQVVALPLVAVVVGTGIASRPVQQARSGS